MSKQNISDATRQRVMRAARYRGGYCLTSQRVIGPLLEIDHIIPEARGGSAEDKNLTIGCPLCNGHKSDKVDAIDLETRLNAPLFNPRKDLWSEPFEWIDGLQ